MAVQSDNYWLANAQNAVAVTPSDSADLPNAALKGLYIGGAGNLSVITTDGDTVALNGVLVGTIVPLQVARVRSSGTTATNIVALY